jgi:hypothetical protein
MEESPKSIKSPNANEAHDTLVVEITMEMQSRSRLLILDLDLFLIEEENKREETRWICHASGIRER